MTAPYRLKDVRALLDENLPHDLVSALIGHAVVDERHDVD